MLLEEFEEGVVESSMARVRSVIEEVAINKAINAKVRELYAESGLTFEQDGKGVVMRHMSQHFHRSDMKRVYNALTGGV